MQVDEIKDYHQHTMKVPINAQILFRANSENFSSVHKLSTGISVRIAIMRFVDCFKAVSIWPTRGDINTKNL